VADARSGQRRRGPRSDALRNDQLILETAARVLAEDPGASIQRIADEAGVVRLTVYRRYRDRDELRRAVFEAAAAEIREVLRHAREREVDTLATLRLLIAAMADTARRYPLLMVGEDLRPLPGQRHRPSPSPVSRAMHQAVFDLVRRGQRDGVLRCDLPPELLPLAISGTLNTALRFALALRLAPERIGEQVADLLLDGFAAADPAAGSG
jgi:AcrR family transcriptional regulator